jgi:hypothetical protein
MNHCKRAYETTIQMLLHPAEGWNSIRHNATIGGMLSEFLYPMTMLCGTAVVLGRLIRGGISFATIYDSLIDAAMYSFSLLAAYHFATVAIKFLTERQTKESVDKEAVAIFTGYSMTVILALEICVGLFPILRLPALVAQFYTLKIVRDGAVAIWGIEKEQLFAYAVTVTIILIALPVATSHILNYLTLTLS